MSTNVEAPIRKRSLPGRLLAYCVHLGIAWPGAFILAFVPALLLGHTVLNFLFGMPGAAPVFAGYLIVGGVLGYFANRYDRSAVACFVFVPPLLAFVWNFSVLLGQPVVYGGGWAGMLASEFGRHCGGSDCGDQFFLTAPLYACVSYSLAAWWALRRAERAPEHAPAQRLASRPKVRKALVFARHLVFAVLSVPVSLGAGFIVMTLLLPLWLGVDKTGEAARITWSVVACAFCAGAGAWANWRRGSKLAHWVFLPWLLIALFWFLTHAGGTPVPCHSWACVLWGCALWLCYGSLAYSLGAWLSGRRVREPAEP